MNRYNKSIFLTRLTPQTCPACADPHSAGRVPQGESGSMQFAAVGMPASSQHREEERLRQASERRQKERQQAQFLQRTFGLPQDEVPLRIVALPAHFHRAPAT